MNSTYDSAKCDKKYDSLLKGGGSRTISSFYWMAKNAGCELKKEKEKAIVNEVIKLDDFPINIFPDDIVTILTQAELTMNHPIDITGSTLLNLCGGLIGNKIKLKMMAGWEAPAIFWTAIVGASGAAKSHPVSFIMEAIDRIDKEYYNDYKNNNIQYELQPENEKQISKPKLTQIIVRDTTMEALQATHEYNENGLIMYRDELKGWLGSMNSYRKGSDEETWLEIFNNKVATIGRVTKEPKRIDNSFVNVIGTIQDAVLSEIITKENGLVERFLFTKTYKDIKELSRIRMDQRYIDFLYKSIQKMHNSLKDIDENVIDINDSIFGKIIEADKRIITLQKSGKETDKFVGYLSKMRTYLPRFILVIGFIEAFFNDMDLVITEIHVQKASKLVDYYIKSARKLFSDLNEVKELKGVVSVMNGKTNKEKAMELKKKGYSNTNIANELSISKQRVGQLLK